MNKINQRKKMKPTTVGQKHHMSGSAEFTLSKK